MERRGREEGESRVGGARLNLIEREEVTVNDDRRIVEGQYEDKYRKQRRKSQMKDKEEEIREGKGRKEKR